MRGRERGALPARAAPAGAAFSAQPGLQRGAPPAGDSGRRRAAQRRGRPGSARAPARRAAPPAARRAPGRRPAPSALRPPWAAPLPAPRGGLRGRRSAGPRGLGPGRQPSPCGRRPSVAQEAGGPGAPRRPMGEPWAGQCGRARVPARPRPDPSPQKRSPSPAVRGPGCGAVKASRKALSIPAPGGSDGRRGASRTVRDRGSGRSSPPPVLGFPARCGLRLWKAEFLQDLFLPLPLGARSWPSVELCASRACTPEQNLLACMKQCRLQRVDSAPE